MIHENKEILLKDLCARLPYGVKYNFGGNEGCDYELDNVTRISIDDAFPIEDCKPYLRSMSSMTDREQTEWHYITLGQRWITENNIERCVDWLNAHLLDYRGLIKKGLALEAPEGMYKIEEL